MAAHNVSKAGYSVLVLEARHRIGGRSQTQVLQSQPGAVIEMGAGYINRKTQPTVYALCEKYDLETFAQYDTGDNIRQGYDGEIYRESFETVSRKKAPESVQKFQQLVAIAASEIDIENFDEFPEDQDVSFADWLDQAGLWNDPDTRAAAESLTSSLVGRMPQELGARYILDYIQSGFGLMSLASEGEDGAQSLLVKNGTSSITDALANDMPDGSIMLNSPVSRIVQQGPGEVYVTTKSGFRAKAKKAILAIPTNTYSQIHFTPPLPPSKRAVVSQTMPGIYAKTVLNYASPWWREAGLVGKFSSRNGPIVFSFDCCNVEMEQYSLMIFISGDVASAWHRLSALGREESVIEHLATLVGPDLASEARNVTEVTTVEWTKEEHIWGGPTSSMGPGMLRKYGDSLRESFGDLHFGGGETAYKWKGYLEGAITAGLRTAEEVIERLGSTD
ncbi:amine oxidase [Colletotrichum plurivorum]|uniref:Amine oxidase n=1 Tax=Colletotrichum plurivorum TaxID=2175906 RepID=A0A8H6KUC5_9PEZI|nr:amine oxidase [Colletotrichum plurivorum]